MTNLLLSLSKANGLKARYASSQKAEDYSDWEQAEIEFEKCLGEYSRDETDTFGITGLYHIAKIRKMKEGEYSACKRLLEQVLIIKEKEE